MRNYLKWLCIASLSTMLCFILYICGRIIYVDYQLQKNPHYGYVPRFIQEYLPDVKEEVRDRIDEEMRKLADSTGKVPDVVNITRIAFEGDSIIVNIEKCN